MKLTQLNEGEIGYISKIIGKGSYTKRIMELGFIQGAKIKVIRKAPLSGPIEYEIFGSRVALRNFDAQGIEVEKVENILQNFNIHTENQTIEKVLENKISIFNEINIALLGNPNSGKTTIYNNLTGKKEKVANYAGVTIDKINQSIYYKNYKIKITDLPGVYSLNTISQTEKIANDFLLKNQPDIVVNIVDSNNLYRNLYLTTDIIDMDIRCVMALNMYDEFIAKGNIINYEDLGKLLGIPIVPTYAKENKGIVELLDKIIEVFQNQDKITRHIHLNYGYYVEESISNIQKVLKDKNNNFLHHISSRFLAIKLIEKDNSTSEFINDYSNYEDIINCTKQEIIKIEKEYGYSSDAVITNLKHGFISGALAETLKEPVAEQEQQKRIFDQILINKFLGLPIFFFIIWLMFYTTFSLGKYPMNWIEKGVNYISMIFENNMEDGMLKDLIIDGVLSGMGGVIIFLPNILILFLFIALMEGTGYMSRAVFILDKFMHKIGLHGKSFIPLVMGFGCNVPAIMSTRILENRNERMITILINPFISCNARLPVYLLFVAAFFPNHSATILFLVYLVGIVLAIATALLLRKFVFKSTETPFVMELPPYRMPTASSLFSYMWEKAREYLKKIAGVILIASIIFWALSYFPTNNPEMDNYKIEVNNKLKSYDSLIVVNNNNDNFKSTIVLEKDSFVHFSNSKVKSLQRENSYIGKIGKTIEPIIRPLGFDWRVGISILSGMTAKEIIISTLAVLYQVDEIENAKQNTLINKLREQKYVSGAKKGEPIFTPLIAFVFMIFVSLYFPCIGTIIAISKETGSWKWGAMAVVYTITVAWLVSFAIFKIGMLF